MPDPAATESAESQRRRTWYWCAQRTYAPTMEPKLDPGVDWITAREASVILGVSPVRVSQLTGRDLLPSVRRGSRYYYRRPQVQVIANARQQRWPRSTRTARGGRLYDPRR
jgi:hypothetical protein